VPGVWDGHPAKRGLQQDDLQQLWSLLLLPVRRPACAADVCSAAGVPHCCTVNTHLLIQRKARSLQLLQSMSVLVRSKANTNLLGKKSAMTCDLHDGSI